jgi:hypothetical protein
MRSCAYRMPFVYLVKRFMKLRSRSRDTATAEYNRSYLNPVNDVTQIIQMAPSRQRKETNTDKLKLLHKAAVLIGHAVTPADGQSAAKHSSFIL